MDKYSQGEMDAVSVVHQLAQILQFHLEMKETVTTGTATLLPAVVTGPRQPEDRMCLTKTGFIFQILVWVFETRYYSHLFSNRRKQSISSLINFLG